MKPAALLSTLAALLGALTLAVAQPEPADDTPPPTPAAADLPPGDAEDVLAPAPEPVAAPAPGAAY